MSLHVSIVSFGFGPLIEAVIKTELKEYSDLKITEQRIRGAGIRNINPDMFEPLSNDTLPYV